MLQMLTTHASGANALNQNAGICALNDL